MHMNGRKLLVWATALWVSGHAFAQAPCAWFDHDGDGFIGANTWLYVLGQYGTSGPMDVDASGSVDVRDLLEFVPFAQCSCPQEWRPETTGHFEGLAVVEYAVHEAALQGLVDPLPAGSVTYRLYALLSEPTDRVLALYGDADAPLVFEAEAAFYGFGSGTGESVTVQDYQPMLDGFFPANAYTTWLTVGVAPEDLQGQIGYVTGTSSWPDDQAPHAIAATDSVGAAWFDSFYQGAGNAGSALLGQFTVMGEGSFSGVVNVLLETANGTGIEQVEGVAFSSSDLAEVGCTDPAAQNFNPAALVQLAGSCVYLGDLDGDGALTVADLMALLAAFGCTDCPVADFNGDGVVAVPDLLLFLGWV